MELYCYHYFLKISVSVQCGREARAMSIRYLYVTTIAHTEDSDQLAQSNQSHSCLHKQYLIPGNLKAKLKESK